MIDVATDANTNPVRYKYAAFVVFLAFLGMLCAEMFVVGDELRRHGDDLTARLHANLLASSGVFAFVGFPSALGMAIRVLPVLFRDSDLNPKRSDFRDLVFLLLLAGVGASGLLMLPGSLH